MKETIELIGALQDRNHQALHQTVEAILEFSEPQAKELASNFLGDEKLEEAIFLNIKHLLNGKHDDPLCKWFYGWYKIGQREQKLFVLRFVPLMIWIYLSNRENYLAGIEAVLLCIYFDEVKQRGGKPVLFNVPSLEKKTYYHNPSRNAIGSLTANALDLFNQQATANVTLVEKPLQAIEKVSDGNRSVLVKIALQQFNNQLAVMPPMWLKNFCAVAVRLASFGFPFEGTLPKLENSIQEVVLVKEGGKRILLSNSILQQLVNAIKYCMFDSAAQKSAEVALNAVHQRALFELNEEILLSTNSLLRLNNFEWEPL